MDRYGERASCARQFTLRLETTTTTTRTWTTKEASAPSTPSAALSNIDFLRVRSLVRSLTHTLDVVERPGESNSRKNSRYRSGVSLAGRGGRKKAGRARGATLNPERTIFAARARYPSPLSIKTPHLLEVIKTERAARSQAYFPSAYCMCVHARARVYMCVTRTS